MGEEPFTLVIDDPLGTSYVRKGTGGIRLETVQYKRSFLLILISRSWEQDKELGLLEAQEREELEDEELISKLARIISNSSKIVACNSSLMIWLTLSHRRRDLR